MTAVPAPNPPGATGVAGAGTARRDGHWSTRAACRDIGDLDYFFDGRNAPTALHICLTHCDVLRQCEAHTEQLRPRPFDCVMGGVAWGAHHARARQPDPAPRCHLCRRRPT